MAKKWNSGNYIASTTTNNDSIWDVEGANPGILQRLISSPRWKGALLRFGWTDLEGDTMGSFAKGFDKIKGYLDVLSLYPGKRLIIFVQLKTFSPTVHSVPKYMRDSGFYHDGTSYAGAGNGQYAYESSNGLVGGYVPNLHVQSVRNRLRVLMRELAKRFDSHPRVEAIVFSEASIARPIGAPSNWPEGKPAWFDGMSEVYRNMKLNFLDTQICQWINADRSDMKLWVPELRAIGIGLGMPDLCPEDAGFNFRNDIPGQEAVPPGNIQHCQDSNGWAIIMGHASRPSLDGQVVNRCQEERTIQGQPHVYPNYPGVGTSRQTVHDFAVDTVGVTHLLWAHNTGTQPTTGMRDPNIPSHCTHSEEWTEFPGYGGRKYNVVTDEWINDPDSITDTIKTRPLGWK